MSNFFELENGQGFFLLENGNGYLLLEQGLLTKQQIIDASCQLSSGINSDVQNSIVADSEMTAEDLFPLAVRLACEQMIGEGSLQDVGRIFSIRLTEGNEWFSGILPQEVLTDYLDCAYLPDFKYSSRSPNFLDFRRQKFTNLVTYWAIHNDTFYTTSPSAGATTIDLFAPGLPEIPQDANTGIDMSDDLRDRIIALLASALRGEVGFNG